MKKTLIAMAVVAVSGAAFAQSSVTLSGKLGVAYAGSEVGTLGASTAKPVGYKSNGLEVTDGNVTFAAVEDLGGGMKAAVSMDVKVRGRGAAGVVDGRDASVSLMGGFGTVALGAIEAGNGIIGRASAGAPTIGQDNGKTLDAASNIDYLSYTSPALIPGLRARAMLIDSIGVPQAGGMEDKASTQEAVLLGLTYGAGPVDVSADYTAFGTNSAVPASAAQGLADKRVRVSGSYDLGMVKLGAGFQAKESQIGVKDNQYMLGVSAPFGPVLVGATYAARDNKLNNALDAKGYELGAQYNLSKRTNVQAAYLSQKSDSAGSKADTQYRIRVMHSF